MPIIFAFLLLGALLSVGHAHDPSRQMIVLNGTSSAGKSTIRKQLLARLNASWEAVSFDDYVTEKFLQELPGDFSSREDYLESFLTEDFGKIVGSEKTFQDVILKVEECFGRGKNVILDAVLNEQKVRQLANQLDPCKIDLALVYCSIPNLKDHVRARNETAKRLDASLEDKLNKRDLARAVRRFSQIYCPCEEADPHKLDSLTRKELEGILSDIHQEYDLAASPIEGKKSFDQFAQDLLSGLGFHDETETVSLKPLLTYDCILDTNRFSAKDCAEQIAACIRPVVYSEIQEIDSIVQALNVLHEADETTLVVFDVGEMIYLLPNSIYRLIRNPHIFEQDDISYVEHKLEEFKKQNKAWKETIKSNIMLKCQPDIVEEITVAIIQDLQSNGIKTIALCSANPGKYGLLESTKEWRYALLKNLGIDFSTSFKIQNLVFEHLEIYHGDYPEYYKGILFGCSHLLTNHNPKGTLLSAFFDAVGWVPGRVIVFDDCKEYLINICEELQKRHIFCQAFWYNKTVNQHPKIDREVIDRQVEYMKQGFYPSDREVADAIKQDSAPNP